jgi:hypothetical protein
MSNKHIKSFSKELANREIQIKCTSYYYSPIIEWLKLKGHHIKSWLERKHWNPHTRSPLVGI